VTVQESRAVARNLSDTACYLIYQLLFHLQFEMIRLDQMTASLPIDNENPLLIFL